MAVEICTLGTGTPVPDPGRAGSGVAIVADLGWLLVDCGRGVTQRALQAGLDLRSLRAVFLTHHHSDHVSDLATLATTRWTAGGAGALRVVVPEGPCSRFAEHCLDAFEDQSFYSQARPEAGPRPRVGVTAFPAGPDPSPVFEVGPWVVESALVDHQPIEAAVGYRITVDEVAITVSGDTAVGAGVEALAAGADVLVHEALRSDRVSPALLAWNAGAESVGRLARLASVRRLILTHLLPAPSGDEDEAAFIAEARAGGFGGPIDIALDLGRIRVA